MKRSVLFALIAVTVLTVVVGANALAQGGMGGGGMMGMNSEQMLGKHLYCDMNLSTPSGQSCQSCHHPMYGWADPDRGLPVSAGVISGRFGNRNSPQTSYAAFSPTFRWDTAKGTYVGGQFWDGRANTLEDQAKGPFLNPLEMANPDKAAVVNDVKNSMYANTFRSVYGSTSLDNVDNAYNLIARAIAAYERSGMVSPFNSKFDQYKAGTTSLTAQELRGLKLFEGKAGCTGCHPSTPGAYASKALFTDFGYDNVGVPKNPNNPFLNLPPEFNPAGTAYVDYGLGGRLNDSAQMGKFKTPSLRNIAASGPYTHNGVFTSIKQVVNFMNTRDVAGRGWAAPEVNQNLDRTKTGNLGLTTQEVDDVTAFLNTLTDSGCCGGGCGGMR